MFGEVVFGVATGDNVIPGVVPDVPGVVMGEKVVPGIASGDSDRPVVVPVVPLKVVPGMVPDTGICAVPDGWAAPARGLMPNRMICPRISPLGTLVERILT